MQQQDQTKREKIMQDFKAGKVKLLVATDVAGRGVDVKNLPYVVNYDFPSTLATYTHRIGRTGRQNRPGTAVSFFTRNFEPMAKDLVHFLKKCGQPIDPYLTQLVEERFVCDSEKTFAKDSRKLDQVASDNEVPSAKKSKKT